MKNQNFEMEALPGLVKERVISEKQALDFIAREIFNNPRLYGIKSTQPELFGEIYLRIDKIKSSIFANYKQDTSAFRTYIIGLVHLVIKSILRDNKREVEQLSTVCDIQESEYEHQVENYRKEEYEYKIMHFKPYDSNQFDRAPYAPKNRISELPASLSPAAYESEKELTSPQIRTSPTELKETSESDKIFIEKKLERKKKVTLLLALKSSYYLTEENIEAVAEYCNIEKERLENAVNTLKKTLSKRIQNYESYKRTRDFSFFQHRKLLVRIIKNGLDEKVPDADRELYEFHTSKWLFKTSRVNERARYVCPTNRAIGEIVNMKEKQVGQYLLNAERIIGNTEKNNTSDYKED